MAANMLSRKAPPISFDRANELLRLDAETGVLTWKSPTWRCKNALGIAGAPTSNGYIQVKLDGRPYLVHRIVWLLANGDHAGSLIDHINGDKRDNRPSNLRLASHKTNSENRRSCKGYSWHKGDKKFDARIKVDGVPIRLGLFDREEDARAAYLDAKRRLHAGCTL